MGFRLRWFERASEGDPNSFHGIKVILVHEQQRVMRPEIIISLLSLKAVGDPRVGGPQELQAHEATADWSAKTTVRAGGFEPSARLRA